jgi:hypothetical protein
MSKFAKKGNHCVINDAFHDEHVLVHLVDLEETRDCAGVTACDLWVVFINQSVDDNDRDTRVKSPVNCLRRVAHVVQ